MGKSGGGEGGEVFDYHGTIAGAVAVGLVSELVAVIVDGAEVWPKAPAWTTGQTVGVNELRCYNGQTWKCLETHGASAANIPSPTQPLWAAYSLTRNPAINGGDWDSITITGWGTLIIYWGTDTQTVPVLLTAAGSDLAEGHPDYKGVCYVLLKDFLFGRERVSAPNVEVVVGRTPVQTLIVNQNGRTPASLNDGQANVLATIAEVLTSDLGLGLPLNRLTTALFQAAAETLDTKPDLVACSPFLTQQTTLRGWLKEMADLSDVWLRYNPATARIEAGVWTHGVAPTDYATLTIDDLTEMPEFDAEGFAAAKTRGVVQFTDRARGFKQSSDQAEDARMFAVLGEHRQLSLQRPAITRRAQALAHASEALRTIGSPQFTGQISVRREKARAIRPGSWVKLDIDLEPGGTQVQQFFRVTSKTTPRRGPAKLSILADTCIAPITYEEADLGSQEPDAVLPPITAARILEAPVALANYQTGQVIALAQRPNKFYTGFGVYFTDDDAGAYQFIGNARGFACRGTLRADFPSNDTGTLKIAVDETQADIGLLSGTVSALTAGDDDLLAILVGVTAGQITESGSGYSILEVCSISAIDRPSAGNYDLTILRARQSTWAASFTAATAECWIIHRSSLAPVGHGEFEAIRQNRITGATPDTGYFKLAPFAHTQGVDVEDCAAIPFEWPPASMAGPRLSLAAPAEPVATAGPYPVTINLAGTWTDVNGDVCAWAVSRRKSDGTAEEAVGSAQFAGTDSVAWLSPVVISGPGTWYVYLRAWDVSGLKTERVIAIAATGSNPKVAAPEFYWGTHKVIASPSYDLGLNGPLDLKCATAGASIKWRVFGAAGWTDYNPAVRDNTPYIFPNYLVLSHTTTDWQTGAISSIFFSSSVAIVQLQAYALKGGMANSDVVTIAVWYGSIDIV